MYSWAQVPWNEWLVLLNFADIALKLTWRFFSPTPATNFLVSRGTLESVSKNRRDLNLNTICGKSCELHNYTNPTYPLIGSIPLFFPNPALVYASAPPNTATELSTPLGFPCRIFSATNAHRFTSSAMLGAIARRPLCETWICPGSPSRGSLAGRGKGGIEMRWCKSNIAVAEQVEKDAEEPRPAPIGNVDRAVKLNEGLRIMISAWRSYSGGYKPYLSLPCAIII